MNYQNAADFIKENRIWDGILKYTWLSKFLFITGIVGGLAFLKFIFDYWIDSNVMNEISLASFGTALSGFFVQGYDIFVIGGLKYVILILMEVIIFHFIRRTIEIQTNTVLDTSLNAFIQAQIRMIKVVAYSWLMETIVTVIVVQVGLNIIGYDSLQSVATLLIQSYFLGFAIIDNYNEIYDMTIKQSLRYANQYAAVTLIIGLSAYVMMLIPLLGTVAGPLVGAVVAALTMQELFLQDRNMAWIFESTDDD